MQNEHDMADDMSKCAWFVAKVRASNTYAQNLYAAMCNMQWQKLEVFPILKEELWTVTWRSAGGIVAELQGRGDYLTWYCSGMGGGNFIQDDYEDLIHKGYVQESVVTDEIREDLRKLGWHPVPYDEDDR